MVAIPGIRKLPKMKKKRVLLVLGIVAGILLLAAVLLLHILPDPGTVAHLFEPKATAIPAALQSNGGDPLQILMNKPLVADFSSGTEEQYSPLRIRFLDLSRGNPETWDWDFGDNTRSALPHPVHQYATPGVYNVTLTVTRSDGSRRTVTRTDVLGVTKPADREVVIDTLRQGVISRGSEVAFLSTDANASILIDGTSYQLPNGSVVKLRVGSPGSGNMNIRNGRLVSFAFPDVTLFVNGSQLALGTSGDCFLPSYRYFQANLSYAILPTTGEMRQIAVNGVKVRAGAENSRILVTHRSDDHNADLTLVTFPAYFEGRATTLDFTTAVIADFEPETKYSGPAPLNVTFRDVSAGSPETWHWEFGDGTVSEQENPSHTYAIPGAYTVTLTVSRGDQADMVSRKNWVVASPPRVVANFTATPLKGPAPLIVKFADRSLNAPTMWAWTFGSNETPMNSSERDPVVVYPLPGTYTVSLTSGNIYGSSDLIRALYITVTDPFRNPDNLILVKTGKRGYVEKDSVIGFTVRDTPATIGINGGFRDLRKGSIVRLVAMSDQQGEIYMDKGGILKFSFPDMALYVDGELVTDGAIDSIYVPYLSDFKTSMSYYLVPNSAYTYISVNGYDVLGDLDNAWIRISSLGMTPAGSLRLISTDNSTYIDGAANQTVHDWVVG
jgi:PKD repeat protein